MPGDIVCGVEKAMGLRKGEKIRKLGLIRIVSTRREPLDAITSDDCVREGFPDLRPDEFVDMLVKHYGCPQKGMCNRIEFEYLDEPDPIGDQGPPLRMTDILGYICRAL